jgi:4-hydroxybenzoyl-CoA thioesterase
MFTNTRKVRIEWGDCDPAGIVFYPNYFAMFDACISELFLAATGMTKHQLLEKYAFSGYALGDARARFLSPGKFGDEAVAQTEVAAVRRASFDVNHRVVIDGRLSVEGFETRVWVGRDPDDPAKIKAQPIPQEIVAKLTGA